VDVTRLQTISAFAGLPEGDLKRIALLASEVSVPEGKDLVREGDFSAEILAILEGTAEVKQNGERVAELGAGDIIGEIGVLDDVKRGATVTATSSMSLVTLDTLDIKSLRRKAPEVVERLQAILEERRGGGD
jgi:CRP-like cAMP-binding protein